MHDKFGRIYLTSDLPGTGGHIKEQPEDFVVEEIPLYDFSDQGNFASSSAGKNKPLHP